jgi:hypothetical protein
VNAGTNEKLETRIFLKRLPGVGSEPGSSQFLLFSHFSPLYRWATAAPQDKNCLKDQVPSMQGKMESYIGRLGPGGVAYVHNGHRARLKNRRSRVRIPPGYKVFRYLTIKNHYVDCTARTHETFLATSLPNCELQCHRCKILQHKNFS